MVSIYIIFLLLLTNTEALVFPRIISFSKYRFALYSAAEEVNETLRALQNARNNLKTRTSPGADLSTADEQADVTLNINHISLRTFAYSVFHYTIQAAYAGDWATNRLSSLISV